MQQTLMIDADDTLWENNILFEQAIASFIEFLDHKTHTPQEVRDHLNRIEHDRVKTHGYGLAAFRASLAVCFQQLAGTDATQHHHDQIERFTACIASENIRLIHGVHQTLAYLNNARHRLLLVTKGNDNEQRTKLRHSGLSPFFHHVEVLREKHVAAYSDLLDRHSLDPGTTWMIGNSPKSDVNPALAAGINAIHVPHHSTWVLEEEPLVQPIGKARLLVLQRFEQLTEIF